MTIIFPANCQQYECPNMMNTCSIFPDSNTICIKNQIQISIQKRLLRAQLIGNMFQAEPKFRIDDFNSMNENSTNNKKGDQRTLEILSDNNSDSNLISEITMARNSNAAKRRPLESSNQNNLNYRRKSGTEYKLTENQIDSNPAQSKSRITLSEYQLIGNQINSNPAQFKSRITLSEYQL